MNGKRTDYDWPKHAGYASGRQYRAQKRAEVRAVLKALYALRFGSAWMPTYKEIDAAQQHLEAVKKAISVRQWKR